MDIIKEKIPTLKKKWANKPQNMETWLLWTQSIMVVLQIICEKLLGGEKEEWIFIKDRSSTL